ncbi:MAG: hypothetical protein RLZZ303_3445 [Candidatus Hydrogenedentota bacterium]|jgi:tetraacyldisaccharide 4'-kinase
MSLQRRIEAAYYDGASLPPGLGPVLSALTLAQRGGMAIRRCRAVQRVDAQVVSFGNITAGGTGKTPAVIERAARECASGRRVAVITRGYGSPRTVEPTLLGPGFSVPAVYVQAGDEAALIRRHVPEVWLIKCADRVAGARAAIDAGCDLLILEDGFQSLSLARNEDIVLLDATRPLGNGRLLPRGPLREPATALARASEVWLTRCDRAGDLGASIELVRHFHGKAPARLTHHVPSGLWRVCDGAQEPLEFLQGRELTLACAIARPKEFEATLLQLGCHLTQRLVYPDHQAFDALALPKEGLVVVTEKDAVRMDCPRDNVYALAIRIEDCP